MAFVPLAIAAVSALSAYQQSRAQRKRTQRMRQIASPEHLREVIQKLLPFYRELAAANLGPQFLQESAREINNAGLSGTGVGEALRTISKSVPSNLATGAAGAAASGVVQNELGVEGANPATNPLSDALLAGTRGYIGASEANRNRGEASLGRVMNAQPQLAPTTTPIDYNLPPGAGPELFPQTRPLAPLGGTV